MSNAGVSPELYATPWFFTYFSQKCDNINLVVELWLRLIHCRENTMAQQFNNYCNTGLNIFTLSIALIIHHRQKILQSDNSNLPGCMAGLSIQNMDDLESVCKIASELYENTPISFWQSDEIQILFGENSKTFYKQLPRHSKIEMHLRLE